MRSLPHPRRPHASLLVVIAACCCLTGVRPAGAAQGGNAATSSALAAGIAAYRAGRYDEALASFRTLAEEGVARAQTVLGIMYAYGEGIPRDLDEAAKWYRRAAEQGYPPAEYNLGLLYLEGGPVPRSERLAVDWLKKAALGGHTPASRRLRELDSYAYAEVQEELRRRARADRPPAGSEQAGSRFRVSTLDSLDLRPPPSGTDPRTATGAADRAAAPPATPERHGGTEPASVARPPPGPFVVQLASSRTAADAERAWARYREAHPELLGELDAAVSRADLGADRGTWYRLRAGPLGTYQEAKALCAALTESDRTIGCLALRAR